MRIIDIIVCFILLFPALICAKKLYQIYHTENYLKIFNRRYTEEDISKMSFFEKLIKDVDGCYLNDKEKKKCRNTTIIGCIVLEVILILVFAICYLFVW